MDYIQIFPNQKTLEGRLERQHASIIEFTRPDSTPFFVKVIEWVSHQSLKRTCNVFYLLGYLWTFYQRFLLYQFTIFFKRTCRVDNLKADFRKMAKIKFNDLINWKNK